MTPARPRHRRKLWTAAGIAILFAWLAFQVVVGATAAFDAAARGDVHAWATPRITVNMTRLTEMGSPWFLAAVGFVIVALLIWNGRWRQGMILAVTALGGEAMDQVLKLAFHRVRPDAFFGAQPESYSFPSGHSMVSLCFYCGAAAVLSGDCSSHWQRVALWIFAGATAAMIGLSRIYLGVHYPTDVLGGFAAGAVWLIIVYAWLHRDAAPAQGAACQLEE